MTGNRTGMRSHSLNRVETDNDKEIFETAPISDLKLSLSGDELKFRSYEEISSHRGVWFEER